jgi:hypothetical protein
MKQNITQKVAPVYSYCNTCIFDRKYSILPNTYLFNLIIEVNYRITIRVARLHYYDYLVGSVFQSVGSALLDQLDRELAVLK